MDNIHEYGTLTCMYRKRFSKWVGLKEKIHSNQHTPPYVSEGDIWWCSFGENVGSEINGKSDKFTRPAIILKKLSHGFYFVIPTTSKECKGNWYTAFRQGGKDMCACLHQARSIDHRRLWSKIGTLDKTDMARVQESFHALLYK